MPALNQDFIIYDLDQFQVRFNVTDAQASLVDPGGNQRIWWGVSDSNTSGGGPQSNYLLIERANANWSTAVGTINVDFGSTALVSVQDTYIDILVKIPAPSTNDGKGGSIDLQPSPASYPAFYYHECIYSTDTSQHNSNGIATGQITVYRSMFTDEGYRA